MSIRTNFVVGLSLLTAVLLCSTFIVLRSFAQIAAQRELASTANELSLAALDFNVENFHTQLEIWEYVYAPNQERLDAFQRHARSFDRLFERLVNEADASTSRLSPAGRETLELMKQQIPSLKATWEPILSAISEQRTGEEVRSAVFASEKTFDSLHFNKNVDRFVEQQKAHVHTRELALASAIRVRLGVMIFLSGVMLIAFAGFYLVFAKRVLVPLARFTEVADAVSRGEPAQAVQLDSKDEVGRLADAFGRMLAAVRFLLTEAQQRAARSEHLAAAKEV